MNLKNLVSNNNSNSKSASPKAQHLTFKQRADKVTKLPKPDQHTVKIVHDLLQSRFVKLFNQAKIDRSKYYDVLKTVTHNPVFRGIKTYNNIPLAKSVLNEVIGLGVVSEIVREHPNVTDIVYNGRFLTYQTSDYKRIYGKQPGEDASILTPDYINQLVNKFANNAENDKSVNPTTPIFDGMYKDMRISVCYGGRGGLTPITYGSTFEIRVTKATLPMNEHNFSSVAPMFLLTHVLDPIVKGRASLFISGETGAGKTSLQKLIIGLIPWDQRIVAIEDTPEIHLDKIYPDKDVIDWITSKRAHVNTARLVEESLRADPKWVMPTEIRDGETAYQTFQSAKTGHSLMTTLHAKDNASVPSRFAGMVRDAMDINNITPLVDDFLEYIDIGVHMSVKTIGGHVYRFLDSLCEFVPRSKKHPNGINPLFKQRLIDNNGKAYRMWRTYPASPKIKDTIRRNWTIDNFQMPFLNDFIMGKNGKPRTFKVDANGYPVHDLNTNKLIPDKNGKPVEKNHYAPVPLNKKYQA